MSKICQLKECSKEFDPKRSDAKYCSKQHKDKDSMIRRKNRLSGIVEELNDVAEEVEEQNQQHAMEVEDDDEPIKAPPTFPTRNMVPTPSLGPLGSFMLAQKGNETEFYKKNYEEERAKRKKLKEKFNAVTTELSELKTNNRIAEIEGAKPKGLAGIGGTLKEVFDHPFAQQVGMALMSKLNGISFNAPGAAPESMPLINWINSMSEEARQAFAVMIQEISKTEDQEKLTELLNRLAAVVTGTTMNASAHSATSNASGTHGY